MAKRRKNPFVSCQNCGVGNKGSREICWKCGFDLGATSAERIGNIRRRTKRLIAAAMRRNPKKIPKTISTAKKTWKTRRKNKRKAAQRSKNEAKRKATIRKTQASKLRRYEKKTEPDC